MSETKPKTHDDNNELLTRIDERTLQLFKDFHEFKDDIKNNFVTQIEFKPIKNIVLGAVKMILVAVFGAIIYLVVKS